MNELLHGGMSAGEWDLLDAEYMADVLKASGNNFNLIEGFSPGYRTPRLTVQQIYPKLDAWIKAMRKHGIVTGIHMVNANDDTFKNYSMVDIKWLVEQLARETGTIGVLLCPVAEETGASEERDFTEFCARVWTAARGTLMFNGDGTTWSVPDARWKTVCYHTQSVGDMGPTKAEFHTIIDTDSPIMKWLQPGKLCDAGRVAEISGKASKANKSFSLYIFNSLLVHWEALCAIARAYGKTPAAKMPKQKKESIWDKFVAWLKGVLSGK